MNPAIFHITHVDNLGAIADCGRLWCDAQRRRQLLVSTNIGLRHIKDRRMQRRVPVSRGGVLGDYVPFNFCSRSVMLYVVSRGHDDYSRGGADIIHLVSSLESVLRSKRPWAFTDGHAEVAFAEYFDDVRDLQHIDWSVMDARYWNDPQTKHRRQAEFLVHDFLPWEAVEQIGTADETHKSRVEKLLSQAAHRPPVVVRPEWYY